MEIKKGIGVSPGVVISTAVVLDAEDLLVPRRQVDAAATPQELERLTDAVAESTAELRRLRDEFSARYGARVATVPWRPHPPTSLDGLADLMEDADGIPWDDLLP